LSIVLQNLSAKVQSKECIVGIYGLGYVGLPLAVCFANAGIKVIGFDIDQKKITQINDKGSYISSVSSEQLSNAIKHGFEATSQFERTTEVDAQIICVPTPLDSHNQPDLSFVSNTVEAILPFFKEGQLMCLESTTWPGTTDEILATALQQAGFSPGIDCALCYSPEREDPGNANFSTATIPKVIGGYSQNCLEIGKVLYALAIESVVPVSSTKVAEMSKLLENIHRAVNIGLVNEMKIVADKMNINIHEVIDAAATKPFGYTPYRPGPGLGGHCIPIDPYYLTWKAKEFGINTRFIELAGEINHYMPSWVVNKISLALNSHQKSISGSRILILGLAYKKNVSDTRESPAIEILDQLIKLGAHVDYSDPFVPVFPEKRRYQFDLQSIALTESTIGSYDCLLLATEHDAFDIEMISHHATLIVDTRNVVPAGNNVIEA